LEKTIVIDGKPVRFKSTGAIPLRYKSQFGKDFFKELMKISVLEGDQIKPEDLEKVDFDVFYNIAWTMAKTADPSIPDPVEWLDGFEVFPMLDIIPELQELIHSNLTTEGNTQKK